MLRTLLHIIGYAALAVILGGVHWVATGQAAPPWLSVWFGACIVFAVVAGRWLHRRWRRKPDAHPS